MFGFSVIFTIGLMIVVVVALKGLAAVEMFVGIKSRLSKGISWTKTFLSPNVSLEPYPFFSPKVSLEPKPFFPSNILGELYLLSKSSFKKSLSLSSFPKSFTVYFETIILCILAVKMPVLGWKIRVQVFVSGGLFALPGNYFIVVIVVFIIAVIRRFGITVCARWLPCLIVSIILIFRELSSMQSINETPQWATVIPGWFRLSSVPLHQQRLETVSAGLYTQIAVSHPTLSPDSLQSTDQASPLSCFLSLASFSGTITMAALTDSVPSHATYRSSMLVELWPRLKDYLVLSKSGLAPHRHKPRVLPRSSNWFDLAGSN